jgi:hypothetical protein
MRREDLAEALRQRQQSKGIVDEEIIHAADDDTIIQAYVMCPDCGAWCVPQDDLNLLIDEANNCDEFLAMCREYDQLHQ